MAILCLQYYSIYESAISLHDNIVPDKINHSNTTYHLPGAWSTYNNISIQILLVATYYV